MVDFFLPAMTIGAILYFLTPFRILCDISGRLPILSLSAVIAKKFGISPKILPVVGIHTVSFMMVLPEGAPFCLKIVHKEVPILG